MSDQGCKHEQLQTSLWQDDPRDPAYPVVVCPRCMTRWFGHEDTEKQQRAVVDSVFSAALRDALIQGSDAHATTLLKDQGWIQYREPDAMISMCVNVPLLPTQSAQITSRPHSSFMPMYLVVHAEDAPYFDFDDIRLGPLSMLLQAGNIPATSLACQVTELPNIRFGPAPNRREENGSLTDCEVLVSCEGGLALPKACSAFPWVMVRAEGTIVIVITNTSDQERPRFRAWVLGRIIDDKEVREAWARAPVPPGPLIEPWPVAPQPAGPPVDPNLDEPPGT